MYEFEDDGVDVTSRKYYSIGGEMVAMREWVNQGAATTYYLASDHLSSTSIVMDNSGNLLSENRYMPFGEARTISGTTSVTETDLTYTGQRDYGSDFGLMDYKARFYSPSLGRFTQPDTIVPGSSNPQAFNRFSYVENNPLKYSDPTGHFVITAGLVMAAIAITSFAGGAAYYQFRVSGNSWWESWEDASHTFHAGMDAMVLGVSSGLLVAETALAIPAWAMYIGAQTNNVGIYEWGATEAGYLPGDAPIFDTSDDLIDELDKNSTPFKNTDNNRDINDDYTISPEELFNANSDTHTSDGYANNKPGLFRGKFYSEPSVEMTYRTPLKSETGVHTLDINQGGSNPMRTYKWVSKNY